jgi:hypothetical protein
VVCLKWPLGRAATFTLTACSTIDGFRRFPPDIGFEKLVVFLAHIDIYAARPEIGSVKMMAMAAGIFASGGIFLFVVVFPLFSRVTGVL